VRLLITLFTRIQKEEREELRCKIYGSTCSVDLLGNTRCTTPTFHAPAAALVAFTGQQLPGQQLPGQHFTGQQLPGQQLPGQQLLSTLVEGTAGLAACATAMPNTLTTRNATTSIFTLFFT